MFFAILTLLTALSIAGIAGWFSIVGLMSIFSSQALATAIMAGSLEIGKLVSASWLYRNWNVSGWFIKTYLIVAVLVLMLITSMGIFGFLSKAHLANTAISSEAGLEIERIDVKINREQQRIQDAEKVIGQLDESVQVLLDNDRIRGPDGAIAVRSSQTAERAELSQTIDAASENLAKLQDKKLEFSQKNLAVETEMGPLKYVAELIYTDQSEENLDRAVRLFILLLVSVFDPLAIILLIAANKSLLVHGVVLEKSAEPLILDKPPEVTKITDTVQEPEPVKEKKKKPAIVKKQVKEKKPRASVKTKKVKSQNKKTKKLKATTSQEEPYLVEPEIREMIEDFVQEATPDINQLQQVAKHLANSRANKNNMTEDEIVEVLASSTQDQARQKLGFWAVKLPPKDS